MKTHQSRATPDKSSDLREELRANGNKRKRLEPGEANKQPSHDVRNERDRVVTHPPPNQQILLHAAILSNVVKRQMKKHRKALCKINRRDE